MPKSSRGGSRNGGASTAFKKAGVLFVDYDKISIQAVEPALSGVKTVLDDFGLPLTTVTSIGGSKYAKEDNLASVNGMNQIRFRNGAFSDSETAAREASAQKGWTVSDTVHGIGTHEAGHVVMNAMYRKTYGDERTSKGELKRQKESGKHTLEKSILKEASKRYGSNPQISRYGSTNYAEKIAEAVSDVYSNGKKANPYSKVIVDVMKEVMR